MKHIKAYTFEELLCEVPELEKYSGTKDIIELEKLKTAHKRFCRENKLLYKELVHQYPFDNVLHFLFEKL